MPATATACSAISAWRGRGTRAARGEHVVAAALDALQRLEVHRAHDLGGDQPPAILGRPRVDRALVELARAAALEREQPPHRLGDDAGGEVVDRAAARRADPRAAGRRGRARGRP